MKIMTSKEGKRFWMERVGDEVLVGSDISEEVLLRLKGDAAARAYELLRRDEAGEGISAKGYNCHAAAQYVMLDQHAEHIHAVEPDYEIPVTMMSIREAVDTLELPCGFQLHTMSTRMDDDGCVYVSHSAVLLGITEAGEPLAFEKDGRGPLRICNLETIRVDQKRAHLDRAYFYGTPKTPAA